jgi:hypothetical protein
MRTLFLLLAATICFASCQKEIDDTIGGSDNNNGGGNNNSSIIGTWDFVGLNAQTRTTSEFDFMGFNSKALAVFNYASTNNTGTISFTDNTMSSNGMAYTVSGDIITYEYEDGVLTDSTTTPTDMDFSVTNSTVRYMRINSDSLYFPDGGLSIETAGGSSPSEPSGLKLHFNGDTLKLTQVIFKDSTSSDNGINYHIQINATGNILLKKH